MHVVNSIFLTLIPFVLLTPGQCKPTKSREKTSMKPVTVVPAALSPGIFNICKNFEDVPKDNDHDKSHDGVDMRDKREDNYTDNRETNKTHGPKEILQDLLHEDMTRQIKKRFQKFTKKHIPCKSTLDKLKKQRVKNYLKVDHPISRNMTPMMEIYTEVAKISLLLSVVTSHGAKQCCLDDKNSVSLYQQFKKRIKENLYYTVSTEIADLAESDCLMEARTLISEPMRCEDVANVIAIVLKHSFVKSKALWKKMKIAEKKLLA